jgi:nitronate monooxygenase
VGAEARVIAANGDDTLRVTVFDIVRGYSWPKEYPGRSVRNRFAKEWHGREVALRQDETERGQYAGAPKRGDAGIAVVFAGEGIDLVRSKEPAVILDSVIQEAEAAFLRPILA